ncbi:unnamed protein product [Sphenostylis stenocarpa]|uniref:Uncharacterized protein n=1 Tax=Sphenostylis stenocarpa TaxID=92480 RepID=A0AA86S006_9FABA|nr:unnamed protein product [Sphenostylis stenocarpa]
MIALDLAITVMVQQAYEEARIKKSLTSCLYESILEAIQSMQDREKFALRNLYCTIEERESVISSCDDPQHMKSKSWFSS